MRVFEKQKDGSVSFYRDHKNGSMVAYRPAPKTLGSPKTKWVGTIVFNGKVIEAGKEFTRIRHLEQWAVGVLRQCRKEAA